MYINHFTRFLFLISSTNLFQNLQLQRNVVRIAVAYAEIAAIRDAENGVERHNDSGRYIRCVFGMLCHGKINYLFDCKVDRFQINKIALLCLFSLRVQQYRTSQCFIPFIDECFTECAKNISHIRNIFS